MSQYMDFESFKRDIMKDVSQLIAVTNKLAKDRDRYTMGQNNEGEMSPKLKAAYCRILWMMKNKYRSKIGIEKLQDFCDAMIKPRLDAYYKDPIPIDNLLKSIPSKSDREVVDLSLDPETLAEIYRVEEEGVDNNDNSESETTI